MRIWDALAMRRKVRQPKKDESNYEKGREMMEGNGHFALEVIFHEVVELR
jgi:hypothetical protein